MPKILIIREITVIQLKKLEKMCLLSVQLLLLSSKNKGKHMKPHTKVIFLLMIFLGGKFKVFAQPAYNECFHSLEICPNTTISANNIGANKTFCPDCEDDFTFCFTANNTVWFKFTTNSVGGTVNINFSNLVFQTAAGQDTELQAALFSTIQPCFGNSYVQIGNCINNATTNFSLTATGLNPNTTYYLVVNGDKSGTGITKAAECTFDINISGAAVDRPVPTITYDASSLNICKNDLVTMTAHLHNCPDSSSYKWYVNGTLVATTQDSVYLTSGLSDGDIVTVTNSCYLLCPQTVTIASPVFHVYTFPIDAGADMHITAGESAQLQGTTTASIYSWSPDFLLTSASILNPVAVPTTTTTYTLSATQNGCTNFDEMTVFVGKDLTIPTTFSPNNDGINDVWEIVGIENYPDNFVTIYDRWGQEIFQKSGYSYAKAWKGETKHDKDVSSSVYFYILELHDAANRTFKGTVTVIK